ncbi:MAG: class I SAM-dependent methyltransferase [archaeon]
MPIFRNELNQSVARRNRLRTTLLTRAEKIGGRVLRRKTKEWSTRTSFRIIDLARGGGISKALEELSIVHKGRKLNILYWGCGEGRAAKELAKNPKNNVFGFSIDSSKYWVHPQGVTFIQTAVDVLPIFLRKKKISLDLIFAENSLKYLSPEKQTTHLCELAKLLTLGAKVFPDPVLLSPTQEAQLRKAGFELSKEKNYLVTLTKNN